MAESPTSTPLYLTITTNIISTKNWHTTREVPEDTTTSISPQSTDNTNHIFNMNSYIIYLIFICTGVLCLLCLLCSSSCITGIITYKRRRPSKVHTPTVIIERDTENEYEKTNSASSGNAIKNENMNNADADLKTIQNNIASTSPPSTENASTSPPSTEKPKHDSIASAEKVQTEPTKLPFTQYTVDTPNHQDNFSIDDLYGTYVDSEKTTMGDDPTGTPYDTDTKGRASDDIIDRQQIIKKLATFGDHDEMSNHPLQRKSLNDHQDANNSVGATVQYRHSVHSKPTSKSMGILNDDETNIKNATSTDTVGTQVLDEDNKSMNNSDNDKLISISPLRSRKLHGLKIRKHDEEQHDDPKHGTKISMDIPSLLGNDSCASNMSQNIMVSDIIGSYNSDVFGVKHIQ